MAFPYHLVRQQDISLGSHTLDSTFSLHYRTYHTLCEFPTYLFISLPSLPPGFYFPQSLDASLCEGGHLGKLEQGPLLPLNPGQISQ